MKPAQPANSTLSGARGIVLIGASAGSGKTHRLTEEVIRALAPEEGSGIEMTGLVAVTFTTRAAIELRSRIRQGLLQSGALESCFALPLARVGTVHAVCLQWVRSHAVELGLPPRLEVLSDDTDRHLRRALELCVPAELRERMSDLATRLGIAWNPRIRRSEWMMIVFHVLQAARANRIAPSRMREMAERSAGTLLALLSAEARPAHEIEARLRLELETAIAELSANGDKTQTTQDAVQGLRDAARSLEHTTVLPWSEWVRVAKCTAAKKSDAALENCRAAASAYAEHPRFRAELRELIEGVFECARLALEHYAEWKARHRLVDYVDMIERTLEVLEQPALQRELEHELEFLVVDEFQDTSPIQLDLFIRLHSLAGKSTWVGDRKQCIFEFAGSDPKLMDSVQRWVGSSGGRVDQLSTNFRSRPELVDFCSDLFIKALAKDGYRAEEVVVTARRVAVEGSEVLAPLGVWLLASANKDTDAACLASGVARMLADPGSTPVVDRSSGACRPVRPGDIAVLVTTNQQAEDLAVALAKLNINAALARPGLLATPEGRMLHAALRMLASDRDDTAAACLDALFEFDGLEPDVWLAAQLNYGAAVRAYRAEVNGQKTYPRRPAGNWSLKLQALAERVDWASPVELVDGVIEAFDLGSLAARWPHPAQRLGNLEALRALTLEYETDCRHYDQAATLSGLIAHLESAQDPTWDGEEMRASDAQFYSPNADAVVLCTYHRAKGLEWPVVVLASLGSAPKKDVFSLHVESDNDDFDPSAPLAGRWLRYWPWPFGAQKKAALRDQAEQSTFGVQVAGAERSERARLLYVGFTRARDHLVFAARTGKRGPVTPWLDELTGAGGESLLKLPPEPPDSASEQHAPVTVRADACGHEVHTWSRVWKLGVETLPLVVTMAKPRRFTLESTSPASRRPYWITPSNAVTDWPEVGELRLVRTERLHPSIRVSADFSHTWEELGDAVHAFFAIDVAGHTETSRLELARRCLAEVGLDHTALATDLLRASDELRVWVARRFPNATWRREVPVGALVGEASAERRINGTIDLLLETPDGYVIIDHKSFPNPRREALESRARDHFPQLRAYGRCLEVLGTKPVLGYFLHFGLAGAIVEAERVR